MTDKARYCIMKNYCTCYELYYVTPGGKECYYCYAYTKAILRKRALKYGLPYYCITTVHTSNMVETIVKKEYFHA